MDENMPKLLGNEHSSDIEGVVYFLKMAQFVKIGFTLDFKTRFATIERVMPEVPQVLATVAAKRTVEATIHRRLRDICLRGEWYLDCNAVRAAMADAIAGQIGETVRRDDGSPRAVCPNVKWASEALAKIAAPAARNEPHRLIIERAANRVGLSYWRAYDIWYRKARRLTDDEHAAISAALAGVCDE
jgi:hypothetical protein